MQYSNNEAAQQAIRDAGWVQSIEWFESVDSTNLAAKRWLAQARSSPALFVADQQTAGRGRSDHAWWSPEGCLMLTLAIDHTHAPASRAARPLLALFAGIAVAETILQWLSSEGRFSQSVELKWPNDVYLQGKKACGILIESLSQTLPSEPDSSGGSQPESAEPVWLIGIGINVDMDWSQAAEDISRKATCLASVMRKPVDRGAVLVHLIERIKHWLELWQQESSQWLGVWNERCLLGGKVVRAQVGQQQIIGLCEGVDAHGRLLLRDQQQLHQLNAAEILDWQ